MTLHIGLELHFSRIRIFQNLIIFVKYASSSVKRDLCAHFQNLFRLEIAVLSPTSQPWVYHLYHILPYAIIRVKSFGYESRKQTSRHIAHFSFAPKPWPCLVHEWMENCVRIIFKYEISCDFKRHIWCLTILHPK